MPPDSAGRGNCVAYAWRRWRESGGYIVFRRSRFYPGPHVIYSTDLVNFEAFVPMRRPRKRLIPPLWFVGRVHRWTGSESVS